MGCDRVGIQESFGGVEQSIGKTLENIKWDDFSYNNSLQRTVNIAEKANIQILLASFTMRMLVEMPCW